MTGRNCPACRRWLPRFAGAHPACVVVPDCRTSGAAFINWVRACIGLAPIASSGVRGNG